MTNVFKISVGKLEDQVTVEKPRHSWNGNVETSHEEVGWWCVNWIHLSQVRNQSRALINMVINSGVHEIWVIYCISE